MMQLPSVVQDWVGNNPILAGLLTIIGLSLHARIVKLVKCLFDFLQNYFLLTDAFQAPDEVYISLLHHLYLNPDSNTQTMTEENLKIVAQTTCWWEMRKMKEKNQFTNRRIVKIPGHGYHLFKIQGVNWWNSFWVIVFIDKDIFTDNGKIIVTTLKIYQKPWNSFLKNILGKETDDIKLYLPGEGRRDKSVFRFRRSLQMVSHPELPILAKGVKEEISSCIQNFLDSKEYYIKVGRPWVYGIGLFGSPGNGKSSTYKWLAERFKLNLCILNEQINRAGEFSSLIESAPSNSLIVLEDIDTLFRIKDRDIEEKTTILRESSTVTLGELLNGFESLLRKEKTIIVITSNKEKKLDPALLRPGRIDKIFRLKNTTPYQTKKLFEFHYPGMDATNFVKIASNKKLSVAQIRGCLIEGTVKKAIQQLNKY
jgi:hypothetical protein